MAHSWRLASRDPDLVRIAVTFSILGSALAVVACNRHINPEWCAQPGHNDPLCEDLGDGRGDGHRDGQGDSQGDGRGDGLDAPTTCDGGGTFMICLAAQPTSAITLGAQLVNTDACTFNGGTSGEIFDPGGGKPKLCVIAGTSLVVSGTVRGQGSRPLAIVATTDLTITASGAIDVASRNASPAGAGANDIRCATSIDGSNAMGGGGAAGGSFGTKGGDGGTNGGIGGTAAAAVAPTDIRGGCHGGGGGNGMQSSGGAGGNGGGAVYLIARGTMTIAGSINASGAGGVNPNMVNKSGGGGGGGSGGMIALYAGATLVQTADVFANGGGGGGAASNVVGMPGGESVGAAVVGIGGSGSAVGGAGAVATQNGNGGGTTGSYGGGGGGGAVGVVKVVSGQALNSNVSPPPS